MIVNAPPERRRPADVRCGEGVETDRGKTVDNVWVTGRDRGDVEAVENPGVPHSGSHSGWTGPKRGYRKRMRAGEKGYPRLHTLYYYY